MNSRRLLPIAVVLAAGLASAQDKPAKSKPLTPEQAADKVLAAFAANDAKTVAGLAAREEPDPWLVADELRCRGKPDQAAAFAKAAASRSRGLPEYLASCRGRPINVRARRALADALGALREGKHRRALAFLETASEDVGEGVLFVRVQARRGEALQALGRLEEGFRAYLEAAKRAKDMGWLRSASRLFQASGDCAYDRADWKSAHAAWELRLAVAQALEDRAAVAATLGNIGLIHEVRGDYGKALLFQQRALRRFTELERRADAARALVNIGKIEFALGAHTKALDHVKEARDIFEELEVPSGVAAALLISGAIHQVRSDWAAALHCFERALHAARAIDDKPLVANALGNVGNIHYMRGEHAKALDRQLASLAIHEELGSDGAVADTLGNIANVRYALGDYEEALVCLARALAIHERIKSDRGVATVLGKFGVVHATLGAYAEALACQKRCLEISRKLNDPVNVAQALGNIANTYFSRGEYAAALDYHQRSLRAEEALRNRAGVARSLVGIGSVYSRLAEREKACTSYERALRMFEAIGDRAGAAAALGNLGRLHAERGDHVVAIRCYERAEKLHEELGSSAGRASILRAIGNLRGSRGQSAEAVELHRRALGLFAQLGRDADVAASLTELGFIFFSTKDYSEAESCLRRALRMTREHGGDAVRAAKGLGFLLLARGRAAEAIPALQVAIDSLDRRRAGVRALPGEAADGHMEVASRGVYDGMALAQVRCGRPDLAVHYLEQGRARGVLDLLRESTHEPLLARAEAWANASGDEAQVARIRKLRKEIERAERELAALTHAASVNGGRKLRAKLSAARKLHRAMLNERTLLAHDLLPIAKPRALMAIQGSLEREECLLFYSFEKTATRLFFVPPGEGSVTAHKLGIGVEQLESDIAAHLAAVQREGRLARGLSKAEAAVDSKAGARLGAALMPEEVRKKVAGLKRVYVIPHGAMHRLPLESLPGWLDTMPPVVYAHSASVLLWCRERKASVGDARKIVVALGDPAFSRAGAAPNHLAPLPGTRREVEAITKALGETRVKTLLGEDATESALREASPAAGILHLATHHHEGGVRGRGYSRLALAAPREPTPADDGTLHLWELLEHWRGKLPVCELVVLAACESATGPLRRDEGQYAIPLGFLYAGARAVIGSHWRVDDATTAELFADFYRRLAKGTPKLQAFTEARKELRKKYPQPYYWAPFVYVGDPR